MMMNPNPREAAFQAILSHMKGDGYLSDYLDQWQYSVRPSSADDHLARQIAYGSVQRQLTLDHLARQLTKHQHLRLKPKERAILHSALYQAHFMDRLPLYAIVDEMVELAKSHCHQTFVRFLNGMLRTYGLSRPTVPQENSVDALSIRYSYPPLFVEALVKERGLEKAMAILELGNQPAPVMVRLRSESTSSNSLQPVLTGPLRVAKVIDTSQLPSLTSSSAYYVQNVTPAYLVGRLSCHTLLPKTVLDLCAAPGGKTIALHDLYPSAELHANDVSPNRVALLTENLNKYNIDAVVTQMTADSYSSSRLFDLIVLDVPCSNSGVLGKRPEARWRLSESSLTQLEELQYSLIRHAITLLAPKGTLWYLTCSILKSENEDLVERACRDFDLLNIHQETVLPTSDGWDGGFGCVLKKGSKS